MNRGSTEVHGRCEPEFESLRHALGDVVSTGFEVGAALVVHVGKQQVVDLWAGHADPARTRPWDGDTPVNLYSVGKAVTALCAPAENLLIAILFWGAIIGLAVPAWSIGAPWGWFAYAGTVVPIGGFIELRQLNNILVRTLPALRLRLEETRRLRHLEEEGRGGGRAWRGVVTGRVRSVTLCILYACLCYGILLGTLGAAGLVLDHLATAREAQRYWHLFNWLAARGAPRGGIRHSSRPSVPPERAPERNQTRSG